MLEDTAKLGQALFSGWWSMLAVQVPGFTFTFGQMYLGVGICTLSLFVLKLLFGFGGSGGESSRSSSSRNPKISKERQGDEF